MSDYLMIEGKKTELSKETANELKKQFELDYYEVGDIFDNNWGDKNAVLMICSAGDNKIAAMNIGAFNTGFPWAGQIITVDNPHKIPRDKLFFLNSWIKR